MPWPSSAHSSALWPSFELTGPRTFTVSARAPDSSRQVP